jgi:hypothetical protein
LAAGGKNDGGFRMINSIDFSFFLCYITIAGNKQKIGKTADKIT